MAVTDGIRCMLLRGGTSKGAYFLAEDLPSDEAERDDLILRIMGSPDARQIDGIGGGHPLTSKVAIVSPSQRDDTDLDYLFLQIGVDSDLVTDRQTCGNLLAGVGPFGIERGLVAANDGVTDVRIHTINAGGSDSVARIETPGRMVNYRGDVLISGVPFPAAAIPLDFPPSDRAILPTGSVRNTFDGVETTCVDAGMPVVILRAADLGISGYEPPDDLEGNKTLTARVESIRLLAGESLGLGAVGDLTVPKMSIIAPPRDGGNLSTRTFIPKRVHTSIGVVGAVSVAAGSLVPGSVADGILVPAANDRLRIEHPTGFFDVETSVTRSTGDWTLQRSAVIRTARKLFDGTVWPR
jgi:4-oxalomesaconate tautomerase